MSWQKHARQSRRHYVTCENWKSEEDARSSLMLGHYSSAEPRALSGAPARRINAQWVTAAMTSGAIKREKGHHPLTASCSTCAASASSSCIGLSPAELRRGLTLQKKACQDAGGC